MGRSSGRYDKSRNAKGHTSYSLPELSQAGLAMAANRVQVQRFCVGLFTEVYHPAVNGVVVSVEGLRHGLGARGHETFCFAPSVPGEFEDSPPVVRMPSLPLPRRAPYRLTLPLVSRRCRLEVVARLDIVHAHSLFVTGWMGLRYARRYGKPFVLSYHTQLEEYAHYVPFDPRATRRAATELTRRFANQADAVIVPTEAMRSRLRESGVLARIEVVPSGVDVAWLSAGRHDPDLRLRLGLRREARIALSVSRLAKEKNLELLLDALARTDEAAFSLVIAGEGAHREALTRRAQALGVAERVRFLGNVERQELPNLYASADVFTFASTTETQGLVQMEALAAGLPTIAVRTPVNLDLLRDHATLVEPHAAAFAEALAGLEWDANERTQRMAHAAESFSLDAQVDRTLEVYRSIDLRASA